MFRKRAGKLRAVALVLVFILGCFARSGMDVTQAEAASKAYWLYGEGVGAGGNSTLYYSGGKFYLSGKWSKGSTMNKAYKNFSTKASMRGMTLKKGSSCKIGEYDGEKDRWDKFSGQDGDEYAGICCWVKIKNKKVVKIYQSA